jgi:hypothetical protein
MIILYALAFACVLAHDSGLDITSPDKWKCGSSVSFSWKTEPLPPSTIDWCQSDADTVTLVLFNIDTDMQVRPNNRSIDNCCFVINCLTYVLSLSRCNKFVLNFQFGMQRHNTKNNFVNRLLTWRPNL